MQTPPPASAPTPLDEDPSKPKIWSVGTLTYTTTGLVLLFIWLLWGDFAWSMKERSMPAVVQLIMKKFSATDFIMGIMIGSLPAAVGLFLGPIISYKSDRHRGKWGRRIPYILLTTPITSLTMFGLAAAPSLGAEVHKLLDSSSPGLNACTLIVIGFCWTLFEFATIATNAVFGALVNDVVPHVIIGRFFGMFRALSLIAGMVFNYYLMGKANEYYAWIFIGMGLLYGIGVTTMCLTIKEGEYPPPPATEDLHGKRRGFLAAAKTYLHECFGHPYYLWYFAGLTLATLAMTPVNLFSVPYAQSINMNMDVYGKCLTVSYLVSLFLAYPLGAIADRIHPLRLTMITSSLYAVSAIWAGLFAKNSENFAVALICHTIISGTFWTASASLAQRLLPRARFAELASAYGIVLSVCTICLPIVLGRFLDFARHGDANKQVYQYTFLLGGAFAMAGVVLLSVLYKKFMALGGPANYVAPEDDPPEARRHPPHTGEAH